MLKALDTQTGTEQLRKWLADDVKFLTVGVEGYRQEKRGPEISFRILQRANVEEVGVLVLVAQCQSHGRKMSQFSRIVRMSPSPNLP